MKRKPKIKKLPKYTLGATHNNDPNDPNNLNYFRNQAGQEQPINMGNNSGVYSDGNTGNTYGMPNNSGKYAAIGGAAIGGAVNVTDAYNTPGTSQWEKDQKAGKAIQGTETAVAGAINPLVGMIHGGVSKIMDKSTADATKTDTQGNLVNRKQAKNQAIGRAFADPMAMIPTMISTGFNRNKYADQIEADAKANIPTVNNAPVAHGATMQYPMGGVVDNPNAEVEKEEVMRSPDGSTMQVDGPSHEMGGVPVNIPDGTQIFSDRLKMPGSKKTFAKLAEQYKVNKQEKILEDSKSTNTAKSSAKLIAELKQRKLDQLFQTQEALKQSKVQAYAKKMGLDIGNQQFPNGGTLKQNMYQDNAKGDRLMVRTTPIGKGYPVISNNDVLEAAKQNSDGWNGNYDAIRYFKPNSTGGANESVILNEADKERIIKAMGYLNPNINTSNRYAMGGTKLPQYVWGGTDGEPEGPFGSNNERGNMLAADNSQVVAPMYTQADTDRLTNASSNIMNQQIINQNHKNTVNAGNIFRKVKLDSIVKPGSYNPIKDPNIQGTLRNTDTPPYTPSGDNFNPRGYNRNAYEAIGFGATEMLGPLRDMYITKMGKKYDRENSGQLTPERLNPAEALRQANMEARTTRASLKDATGGNVGSYLSNLTRSQAANTMNKAAINQNFENANVGIGNQFMMHNQSTKMLDKANEQQNKARSEDIARNAFNKASQIPMSNYRDYKAGEVDKTTAAAMQEAFKDPEFRKFFEENYIQKAKYKRRN